MNICIHTLCLLLFVYVYSSLIYCFIYRTVNTLPWNGYRSVIIFEISSSNNNLSHWETVITYAKSKSYGIVHLRIRRVAFGFQTRLETKSHASIKTYLYERITYVSYGFDVRAFVVRRHYWRLANRCNHVFVFNWSPLPKVISSTVFLSFTKTRAIHS